MVDKTNEPIRVLLVEDVFEDAELNKREIRKSLPDCVFQVVQTKDSFLDALDHFQPHVIVSDYSMPQFDGLTALHHALQNSHITPFILCTGSLNEDTAVDCMKQGATDYIIKEHIKRLGSSVVNALKVRDAKIQVLRRKQREKIHQADQQTLLNASQELLLANSIDRVQSIVFTTVKEIVPDSIVVLSVADTAAGVGYLVDVHGLQPFIPWLQKVLSIHLSDFTVPLGKEAIEDMVYNQGKMVRIENGLYTFMNKAFSEKTCQMIEKKLNVSFIYHIGISSQGDYKGGITLLQNHPLDENKTKIIEVLVKQSSVTYEKLEALSHLKTQQNRLESLLKLVQIKTNTVQEFLDLSLQEVVEATQSKVGFLLRLPTDLNQTELLSYSNNIVDKYGIEEFKEPFPRFLLDLCKKARQCKEPFQVEELSFSSQEKKKNSRLTKRLHNIVVLPIDEKDQICAVLVVGEKAAEYTNTDIEQLTLMLDSIWKWVKQKESDQDLFQRKEQLHNILEFSPIITIRCNDKGELIESNRTLKVFLGLDGLAEPTNLNCFSLFHFSSSDIEILQTKGIVKFEKTVNAERWKKKISDDFTITPPPGLHDFDIICKKLQITPDSDSYEYIMQVHNITDRKQIDRAKNEFIQTVSHEMRTPLTSIKQSVLLMKECSTSMSSDQSSLLDIAIRNTERLTKLIQNMLDFQKLTTLQFYFHKKYDSINDLIKQVVSEFSFIAKESDISFQLKLEEDLPPVLMDPDKISQVVTNLVDNAVKFTPEGTITIATEKLLREGQVKVSVIDTGIGIKPENIDKLMQPFFKILSDDMKKAEGTGLGLPICKKILDLHGTDCYVESLPGKGSTFYFYLQIKSDEGVQ